MTASGSDHNPRLLIVDDDPQAIQLLANILHGFGEIFFAMDGQSALSMLAEKAPDILLMDAEMPGSNGFDTCRMIKSDPAHADLPVLFVTAHSDVESEIRALNAGAVDFITKPFSLPIVQARVRTHLALKERTDQLRRLASLDGLTGVANRRAFDIALAEEWRRSRRSGDCLSVLMIDVDLFKAFNDRYGHPAGDDCLGRVALALGAWLRRPGELLARYGGEEFIALLPNCDSDQTWSLGEMMRTSIADLRIPHEASPVSPYVSISGGIASFRPLKQPSGSGDRIKVQDAASLIEAADQALYAAKQAGRNRLAHAAAAL